MRDPTLNSLMWIPIQPITNHKSRGSTRCQDINMSFLCRQNTLPCSHKGYTLMCPVGGQFETIFCMTKDAKITKVTQLFETNIDLINLHNSWLGRLVVELLIKMVQNWCNNNKCLYVGVEKWLDMYGTCMHIIKYFSVFSVFFIGQSDFN